MSFNDDHSRTYGGLGLGNNLLGVGVILLAAGFVIVALTEGPNKGELTRSVPEQPRVLPASTR